VSGASNVPNCAPPAETAPVVAGCPSGALVHAIDDGDPVDAAADLSITPIVDGPYRVCGCIQVVAADGRSYERRERQTLCRCENACGIGYEQFLAEHLFAPAGMTATGRPAGEATRAGCCRVRPAR
jgi:hypothetical protein